MEKTFSDLGVEPSIIKAIEEMDFINPTEVQKEAIPEVLKNKDLIVMSKTGSGKTGAFGIPVIQQIDKEIEGPQCLILAPTRELIVQVDSDLRKMSKNNRVGTTAVYGQHNINTEIEALKKGVSIVSGTPGRVYDHIQRKTLDTKNIRYLVLDEADRMLDMGFIDQVVSIIKRLPKERVTLLFSATMPDEIKDICRSYMKDPFTIELESDTLTVDTVEQIYYKVKYNEKNTQLNKILKVEQPESGIVFCNTRVAVERVNAFLERKGYVTAPLHGAISQHKRLKTVKKIKKGDVQIIVATDVAARGLHIDNLGLVINYDVPVEKDSYVHRIGRTGRAGNTGKAITFVTSEDFMAFYEIEEHVGVVIYEEELPTDAYVKECVSKADGKWVEIMKQNLARQSSKSHKGKPKASGSERKKSSNRRKPADKRKPDGKKPEGRTVKEGNNRPAKKKSQGYKKSHKKTAGSKPVENQGIKTESRAIRPQRTQEDINREIREKIKSAKRPPVEKKSFFAQIKESLFGKK
ncbi:Superfamily II DNA and RNA helicase [Dethiosulfatibacter aminovorans DSM 17477]|uniref:Superfamily II DNA and RNA helicase n=1 Tax=Dethiosulfatibacter aminovorans DSM 17477 TaxID=1121476 RepID=A0A1M6GD75_9FIRM|nr:DEAD/DEAH box helicase [Dethiosulfatibacter aminovorans]SHJ07898.1 Superfamily II DNA and RNA helicase [Dethiosulfatibacter aminovorans DSM 17477]